MAETSVPLSRGYTVAGKTFSAVLLREPTVNEIWMGGIGEPQEWQPVPGGMALVTYPERIDAYLQRLAVEPAYEHLSPLGTADALKLKAAICGFFMGGRTEERSPGSSSSVSAGAPVMSGE